MAVSAVVLSKNEEKNIKACLQGLDWCDEIILIDDYSNDKTIKIAKALKAKVYKRALNNDYSQQRNFGLKKAKNNWVLFIDADERVPPILRDEIKNEIAKTKNTNQKSKTAQTQITGFYLKRKDKFLGKWLNFGETSKVRLLRLAKKNTGQWQGKIHEVWKVKGKTELLKKPLIHQRDIDIGRFLKKIDNYSSIRAQELFNQGVKSGFFDILAFPIGKFLQNYILRLGFLDGVWGVIMAVMMSWHSFLVRSKLYLLWKTDDR